MGLKENDGLWISWLIFKYYKKALTVEEEIDLNIALTSDETLRKIFDELTAAEYVKVELDIMNHFDAVVALKNFHKNHIPKKEKSYFLRFAIMAAAAILLIVGLGLFYFNKQSTPKANLVMNDIAKGKNTATLILANGKRITLDNAKDGELVNEAGVIITKTKDGQIIYTIDNHSAFESDHSDNNYNTLFTANGETFQVCLPDGSKVWLNAGTSLKYPVNINSRSQRKVELNGEAYFEIFKDKRHPFIVESDGQKVEVLGTHFNVNSYKNEPSVKTTLLEGSVKVNEQTILKPNQQSILTAGQIKVIPVLAESYIDWKEGVFNFEYDKLPSVMRKIGRWYDVEIIYMNTEEDNQTFSGYVSRSSNVSEVLLRLAEISNLEFKLKGKTIVVSKISK